ncbi:kinase-like domain-containing protein [Russula earlei]|uniref:Kinase-like domain-containing protein n=1 Tax=Russula earlei TaxID=71964 RepID=A0ACC0TUB2_9AGAM|nr:kinase-like domain-containing protein [Russula earlei]
MRLYKQKVIPNPCCSFPDCPPRPPPASPGSPNPYRLQRAAEAVSKQIIGHKAMVAQFKEMKLPRPPMFSTKSATAPRTDPRLQMQGKATNGSGKSPTVPRIPKVSTSAVSPKQRRPLSHVNTNLPSPSRPPRLGVEKATHPAKKTSTPRAASSKPQSLSYTIRPQQQKTGAKFKTTPIELTPTHGNLASLSVTSTPRHAGCNEPILFVSCFHSLEENSELEDEPLEMTEPTFDLEAQVKQIFSVGLGFTSESEVVQRDEIPPPKATPVATSASTLEPMSAIVEWWEPAVNAFIESDIAMKVKCKGPGEDFSRLIAPVQMGSIHDVASLHTVWPSLSAAYQATSSVRFDIGDLTNIPCQPPSSADYDYITSLSQDRFGAVALATHKSSRRRCVVKVISSAIVVEESVIRAVIEEQRIMRDASGYPLLVGLLASFYDDHGFYLVSEYCSSTLFDERLHMPKSHKKLASAELACAVDHLHGLGIIHRDIRLENVMVKNDGHVALGDFGLAIRLDAPSILSPHLRGSCKRKERNNALKTRGVCGTLPYMAPEVLCNMEYSYGVDWFAYGVFLHVFYLDKFPWLGEYEHPTSYLKEMMATISHGLIFQDGSFGDLLTKLFCVDQDARADFSAIRRATFFTDFDWKTVPSKDPPTSYLFPGPVGDDVNQFSIDSNLFPDFTWQCPSMIIEEASTNFGGTDSSFESTVSESYTPSHCNSSSDRLSLVSCGNLQFFNSFSLSQLFHNSSCDSIPEVHTDDSAVRPLDEGDDPIYTPPAEWIAAFRDSGICLGPGSAAVPTRDDEALVRTSIRSLDVGEEPVFELPSGWKEAFVSPSDATEPSQPQTARKTSVLPRLKSLWKRARGKFGSRQM